MDEARKLLLMSVQKVIKDNNITADELNMDGRSTIDDLRKSIGEIDNIAKSMYDRLVEEIGEKEAYDWAECNIDSHWRAELEIFCPRKYQLVKATMTTYIMVPQDYSDYSAEDYLMHQKLCEAEIELDVEEDNISQDSLHSYEYINDEDDFDEGDFR